MKYRLIEVIALTSVLIVGGPLVVRAQGPMIPWPLSPPPHTIEVTGHAEVRATPDLATLNFAIETHGDTADEAARRNAALARKVVQALQSKLGDKGKIWTAGYNLFPDYAQDRIIGYRAENAIYVETTATDQVGALIDAGIAAGSSRVNTVGFSLRDDSKARGEAITKASVDAQAQAQALATSLGIKLKGVFRATTEGAERPFPMVMGVRAMTMEASAAPTPIKPSELTVPATVSLTYEIQQGS